MLFGKKTQSELFCGYYNEMTKLGCKIDYHIENDNKICLDYTIPDTSEKFHKKFNKIVKKYQKKGLKGLWGNVK